LPAKAEKITNLFVVSLKKLQLLRAKVSKRGVYSKNINWHYAWVEEEDKKQAYSTNCVESLTPPGQRIARGR
jgi:hypothetical protein